MKWTRFLIIFILTGLVLVLITSGIPVNSQSRPTAAIVDALSGTIRRRTCATCASSAVARGNELPATNTTLLVSASRPGGREHWAHLRFISRSSSNIALVQAGTDARESEYRFPCSLGSGTGVWGLRQGSATHCSRITVNAAGWRSQHNIPSLAHKSSSTVNDSERIAQQQDPGQLTITPSHRLTLIYVYQEVGSTVVNVLAGSATIRTPSSRLIVRAGVRYISYGDDDDGGDTEPIPQAMYDARPVQIFLAPENWSQDLRAQIGEFQRAVDQTRTAAEPPPPSDPDTIFVPEPWDPFPDRPSNPQDSDDDDYDEPSDPQSDPPDSAPPNAPPVSDDILDTVPTDVINVDPIIDYGGSSQPPAPNSDPVIK